MASHVELDRFRAEWKRELGSRRQGEPSSGGPAPAQPTAAPPPPVSSSNGADDGFPSWRDDDEAPRTPGKGKGVALEKLALDSPPSARRPALSPSSSPRLTRLPPAPVPPPSSEQQSAVGLYASAVASERAGMLDDALQGYRKAFRLNGDVDREYHRLSREEIEFLEDEAVVAKAGGATDKADAMNGTGFKFARTVQVEADYRPAREGEERAEGVGSTAKLRRDLIASFEASPFIPPTWKQQGADEGEKGLSPFTFHPHDPSRPLLLARLPSELLLSILASSTSSRASPHSMAVLAESFARTCRAARLLTLENGLWRQVCLDAYQSEGLAETGGFGEGGKARVERVCRKWHDGDWRRMYIEEPRIRTDGCFIAVLSYLRRGETSGFYSQSHFVTYFRYLRFSPNGTCLSLLTTEAPPTVVRRLDGSLRMKGLAKGMWRLEGERLTCFELEEVGMPTEEEGGRRRGRRGTDATPVAATAQSQAMDEGMPPAVAAKYKFVMESRLRSTQRGKMNKLEIVSLATEHKVTGELTEVPLKHSKPFFFSRVLAYES